MAETLWERTLSFCLFITVYYREKCIAFYYAMNLRISMSYSPLITGLRVIDRRVQLGGGVRGGTRGGVKGGARGGGGRTGMVVCVTRELDSQQDM